MDDVQENHFTTEEEFQVERQEDGGWKVYDFEWDLELFSLPASFTEEQVRLVCRIVHRRMEKSYEWGERDGRTNLQGDLAKLLNIEPRRS